MLYFHTGIKLTGTNSHKSDPVSVCLIHICLNLKYKSRKLMFYRIDQSDIRFSRKWCCCHLQKMLQGGQVTDDEKVPFIEITKANVAQFVK